MKSSAVRLGSLFVSASLLAVVGCSDVADDASPQPDDEAAPVRSSTIPLDVERALAKLGNAEVIDADLDGVPTFVRGELGRVSGLAADAKTADRQVRGALVDGLAPFRLRPEALALRKMNEGAGGRRHFRYVQKHEGLDVVGGDLVVSIDANGVIYAINGSARGDVSPEAGRTLVGTKAASEAVAADARFHGKAQRLVREVFLDTGIDTFKTYELEVSGERDGMPFRDLVYVDVDSGDILEVLPQIHSAKNRQTFSAQNGFALPGVLVRSEGMAASADADINAAHDHAGITYDAYKAYFNRDSFNALGGVIKSSVHYGVDECNAWWNGTQIYYGDGAGPECLPLARALDVTAHEMTHAVTDYESNLWYGGESGAINESLSDVFGAFVESYHDGSPRTGLQINSGTFLVAEDVATPYFRNMCNPTLDGESLDWYQPNLGSYDVHYGSGVGNLMFCLLVNGGEHPRVNMRVPYVVPAIGMNKAIRIAYYANANLLTSTSNYTQYRTAMMEAAAVLYGAEEVTAVQKAFGAVGVLTMEQASTRIATGSVEENLSGAQDSETHFKIVVPAGAQKLTVKLDTSDGSGNADLYVKHGSVPTLISYACRPYLNSAEECVIYAPAAGTWYLMLRGRTSFADQIVWTSVVDSAGDSTDEILNGVSVYDAGLAGSQEYWKVTVPAGKTLTVKADRYAYANGEVDLYVRAGAKPTTSVFTCKGTANGLIDTCTVTSAQTTTYFILVRAVTNFSGLSMTATY